MFCKFDIDLSQRPSFWLFLKELKDGSFLAFSGIRFHICGSLCVNCRFHCCFFSQGNIYAFFKNKFLKKEILGLLTCFWWSMTSSKVLLVRIMNDVVTCVWKISVFIWPTRPQTLINYFQRKKCWFTYIILPALKGDVY